MARAQGDHEARIGRKNGTNWFKYLWRKAGTKSEAIEPWLHLIPDEYGLSLVRGAIGIVFHMAEKAHEKEKAILEGFETITDTIRNAMNKGASFHSEPEMHACCQALYDCLVDGIADLIWSLKPETKGKESGQVDWWRRALFFVQFSFAFLSLFESQGHSLFQKW